MRRNLCRRALCAFLSLVLLVGTCGLAVQAKGLTGINWMASADKGVQPQFTEVPILMYHHLVEEPDDPAIGQDTLWVGQFRRQLELLRKEGYHTVSILQEATGQAVTALSYPGGSYDARSEKLLQSYGVQCTLTIHPGKARLLPRVPESLYALNRFYVKPSTTDAELLQWVG